MLINESTYYVTADKDNNLFVFSHETQALLVICENMNGSDKYYKLTLVYSENVYYGIVTSFLEKYFNNLTLVTMLNNNVCDEYFVGILSIPVWFEFTCDKQLPFTEIVNILDDATVHGFNIKVENGKIYYRCLA